MAPTQGSRSSLGSRDKQYVRLSGGHAHKDEPMVEIAGSIVPRENSRSSLNQRKPSSPNGSSGRPKGGHAHAYDEGHGHAHGGGGGGQGHSDDEEEAAHREARDHNMWGLFIHFLGDVLTSLLVLGVGLAYYFHPPPDTLGPNDSPRNYWVNYLDPGASVVSVLIILLSAWPLVKACSWILLQSSPSHVDLSKLRRDILAVAHVEGLHELHVWQLVDGLSIGSVHVVVSRAAGLDNIVVAVKSVLHRHGIHSSTVQPEVAPTLDAVARGGAKSPMAGVCVLPSGSCVRDCAEEPCCPVTQSDPTWP